MLQRLLVRPSPAPEPESPKREAHDREVRAEQVRLRQTEERIAALRAHRDAIIGRRLGGHE